MTFQPQARCHTSYLCCSWISPPDPHWAQFRREKGSSSLDRTGKYFSLSLHTWYGGYQEWAVSISDNRYQAHLEYGFRTSDARYRVSDILDISDTRYRVPDIRISDARYRVSGTEGKKHLPAPAWTELSSFYVVTAGTGGEKSVK